jgi:tRNA U54 and U55 pseudouridine synthase Pus10
MTDLPKIPATAKEIIKHKRTGKVYASKTDFDNDVANPNTDTTVDDFRQDLEIKVTKVSMGAATKK